MDLRRSPGMIMLCIGVNDLVINKKVNSLVSASLNLGELQGLHQHGARERGNAYLSNPLCFLDPRSELPSDKRLL